jgi:nitrile hydratase accessory protein
VTAARTRLDRLRAELPGAQQAFTEPWELRALALVVAAHESGRFPWPQFQSALIVAIKRWESQATPRAWSYYACWVEALEALLSAGGALTGTELDDRTHAVLATSPAADHAHHPSRTPIAVDPARTSRPA